MARLCERHRGDWRTSNWRLRSYPYGLVLLTERRECRPVASARAGEPERMMLSSRFDEYAVMLCPLGVLGG